MAVTFKVDSNTIAPQPTSVEEVPATAITATVVNGGAQASARAKGGTVRVTWGVQGAPTAILAALRTARNSLVTHAISWVDPAGVTQTRTVQWLSDPPYTSDAAVGLGRITVVFVEAP